VERHEFQVSRIRRDRPEPLFILAPARSYSTVSTALLAGHPGTYGFPELQLFTLWPARKTLGALMDHSVVRSVWPLPSDVITRMQSGILRTLADLHDGCQDNEAIERARIWLNENGDWPTVKLLNYLLDMISPRMGLVKSPEIIMSDERLRACFTGFPNARYLHLTRHPVSTQQSMHENWRDWDGSDRKTLILQAASTWYFSHRRVVRAFTQLPDRQWMRLRAEDLLREPQAQLQRLLAWLDLPFDDQVIARMLRTQDWQFAGNGPDGNLYGGDAKFMNSPVLVPPPEPGPVTFDQSWDLPGEMCSGIEALAGYLGY